MKKKLPEIGSWVFSTSLCPADATAAVVNEDGELVWYRGGRPKGRLKCNHLGGWDAERAGGIWWHNPRTEAIYCDTSDWTHGIILRAERKNITSPGTVMLPKE